MHRTKPTPVSRLEQFLQSYDELMWAAGVIAKGQKHAGQEPEFPLSGPVLHHKELRKHLLEIDNVSQFDSSRFFFGGVPTVSAGKMELKHEALDAAALGSFLLAGWTTESRRVFHLDPDLQALLGATSIDSVKTNDISLPFGCFGISLERPIKAKDENREFDFILYGMTCGVDPATQRGLILPTVMLISTQCDHWRPVSCREQVDRKVSRGKFDDAWALVEHHNVINRNARGLYRLSAFERSSHGTVGDVVEGMEETLVGSQAWRIVYGLCLYLSTLSKDSPQVSPWTPVERSKKIRSTPDLSAITDEGQVCTVSSTRSLAPEEREMLFQQFSGRDLGYEMRAHFRMGHWRRPPRTAHNAEQPKTVWIHPTIVRRDRLPEGAVPAGSEVILH